MVSDPKRKKAKPLRMVCVKSPTHGLLAHTVVRKAADLKLWRSFRKYGIRIVRVLVTEE